MSTPTGTYENPTSTIAPAPELPTPDLRSISRVQKAIQSDPVTFDWLSNWLSHRKGQLENNISDYTDYLEENYPLLNGFGFRVPFHRSRIQQYYGLDNVDKVLTEELQSSILAPEVSWETYQKNTENPFDSATTGGVRFWKDGKQYVSYNYGNGPDFIRGIQSTKVHERTHALNAYAQESAIDNILSKANSISKNYSWDYTKYLTKPTEVYSRLMEYRFNNKLTPDQVIDKKYLEENRSNLRNHYLDVFDDDTLLRLFNEVADNGSQQTGTENLYARRGAKLIPRCRKK